jgi:hypothetical protein
MEFIKLESPIGTDWVRLSAIDIVSVITSQRGYPERDLVIGLSSGRTLVSLKFGSMAEATEEAQRIIKHATSQATRPVRTEEMI